MSICPKISNLNSDLQKILKDSEQALALFKTFPKRIPEEDLKKYQMDKVDKNEISQHVINLFNLKNTQFHARGPNEKLIKENILKSIKEYGQTVQKLERLKNIIGSTVISPIARSDPNSLPKEICLSLQAIESCRQDNGFTMVDTENPVARAQISS